MHPQAIEYLEKHGVFHGVMSVVPIHKGASGARLYRVADQSGQHVLKQMHRLFCADDTMFSLYQKEWQFYSLSKDTFADVAPKVEHIEETPDLGMLLVFPHYITIEYPSWDSCMQLRAIDLCARLHSTHPSFPKDWDLPVNRFHTDNARSREAMLAWERLLDEHAKNRAGKLLESMCGDMEAVCGILNEEPRQVCHGDFHADNLMLDGNDLVLCDWQNAGYGKGAGDVSFFVSRGRASGIDMDMGKLVAHYCMRLSCHGGPVVHESDVYRVVNASTVFTSFMYWPFYLQNSGMNDIMAIYDKMAEAYRAL